MAKKKQTKAMPEIRELENTLLLNDNIYKVNAVHAEQAAEAAHAIEADHAENAELTENAKVAEKVRHQLIINEAGLNDTVSTDFDGSSEKIINMVPTSGGKFTGNIAVPDIPTETIVENGELVLNYNDIVAKIINKLINTSTMATWSSEPGELVFLNAAPAINGLCVVKGIESELVDFVTANSASKWLPDYIYICTDTSNLYLGTSNTTEFIRLAATAYKLDTICNITTDLSSDQPAAFDGSVSEITPGVTGVLGVVNGGTGSRSLSEIAVGKADQLTNAQRLYANLETSKDDGMLFDGSSEASIGISGILQEANGGTGKQSLADVTVGNATNAANATRAMQDASGNIITSYYQKKITLSPNNPSGGVNGDIWIKY